jgi:hypothetical protein
MLKWRRKRVKPKRPGRKAGPVSFEPFRQDRYVRKGVTFDTADLPATRSNRLECSMTHGKAAHDTGSLLVLRSSGIAALR